MHKRSATKGVPLISMLLPEVICSFQLLQHFVNNWTDFGRSDDVEQALHAARPISIGITGALGWLAGFYFTLTIITQKRAWLFYLIAKQTIGKKLLAEGIRSKPFHICNSGNFFI